MSTAMRLVLCLNEGTQNSSICCHCPESRYFLGFCRILFSSTNLIKTLYYEFVDSTVLSCFMTIPNLTGNCSGDVLEMR